MTAAELLEECGVVGGLDAALAGQAVDGLEYDSRRVGGAFLFWAFPGAKADGRKFADDALARGALAVVSESPRPDGFKGAWIQVAHGRRSLAIAARRFYGEIDRRVKLIGVTGTNGKTTTAWLIDSLLTTTGAVTGLAGTIEYRVAGESRAAVNTTPESLDLHRLLADLAERGGTHLTMEVSSHALALGRVWGMEFEVAVFTNLSQDHLDFHHSMEAYFTAKSALFSGAGARPPKYAVINADDEWAARLPLSGDTTVIRFGSRGDLRALDVESSMNGLRFTAAWRDRRVAIRSGLVGRVNIENILAAAGAGFALGLGDAEIERGIERCAAVPGRFERVHRGQPFGVFVDYAHTPDALERTVSFARSLTKGRVITLFGCGGDRDREKRPLMGHAAGMASDFVVLTSDNPRGEDPLGIINDAMVGLQKAARAEYIAEPDRKAAIRIALSAAKPGDIVVLAGKGHEDYQVLADRTIHFSDREVAAGVLSSLGYGDE